MYADLLKTMVPKTVVPKSRRDKKIIILAKVCQIRHVHTVFQSFVFGHILANFGSFWQLWVEFAALAVADSMLKDHLKS
jgi:hypothetical protein